MSAPLTPASDTGWTTPWTLRTLLLVGVIGPAIVAAAMIWQSYRATEREAYDHLRYTLRLLHANAERAFQAFDLVLARAADRIDGLTWPIINQREGEIQAELKRIIAGVEQVSNLILVAPNGRLTVSTGAYPVNRIDNSDRGYYRELAERDLGVFVDGAVLGRVTGRPIFNVARRRPSGDGGFDGVIAVASEQEYWVKNYSSLDQSLQPSVSLVRASGDTIVRVPTVPLGQARPTREFMYRIQNADEDYYKVRSEADDSIRLIGYKRLSRYPLYLVYTISEKAAFVRWQRDAWIISAFGIGGAAMLSFILLTLRRRMRSQWELRHALAQANEGLEAKVAARTEQLSQALEQKQMMLREIHHRVKNNLQVVASLLNLQGGRTNDVEQLVRSSVTRVNAIGLVHDQLHRAPDAELVEFGTYLDELCHRILTAMGAEDRGIRCHVICEPFQIDLDRAVPLGLAICEMISNSINHAFPGGRGGNIWLELRRVEDTYTIEVRDDGIGMEGVARGNSLGMTLIESLVRQVGGELSRLPGPGTGYRVEVPATRLRPSAATNG